MEYNNLHLFQRLLTLFLLLVNFEVVSSSSISSSSSGTNIINNNKYHATKNSWSVSSRMNRKMSNTVDDLDETDNHNHDYSSIIGSGFEAVLTSSNNSNDEDVMRENRLKAIPGLSQTYNGYDTESGTHSICWKSMGYNESASISTAGLIGKYNVQLIEVLKECPGRYDNGMYKIYNNIHAYAPTEIRDMKQRLRTGTEYHYTVHLQLDVKALLEEIIGEPNISYPENNDNNNLTMVSDRGLLTISLQIMLCELGKSGFCTPFVHEQSDARLVAMNESTTVDYGDLHGGSHVHSKNKFLQLPEYALTEIYSETIPVPMLVNSPGVYYAIASAQIYIGKLDQQGAIFDGNNQSAVLYRYDIANAVSHPNRYILYQDPPAQLKVSNAVLYFSYVIIGIVSSTVLFLLFHTIKQRNHSVFKLTQGPFLIVFLCSAFVASLASFFINPINDMNCFIGPFIMILALQLMYATTLGRLWRINALINPLLVQMINQQQLQDQRRLSKKGSERNNINFKSCWDRVFTKCFDIMDGIIKKSLWLCCRKSNESNNKKRNMRKQVTNRHLALVIALVCLPQIVLQILSLTIDQPKLNKGLSDDGIVERYECTCCYSDEEPNMTTFYLWGVYYFFLTVIILFCMALATRNLPSLLNETAVILETTITTTCLLILGVGIVFITESSTTSPSVLYIVKVFLSNVFAMGNSVRIILPKLRIAWGGETIVVSKLVSDHVTDAREKGKKKQPSVTNVTGLKPPSTTDSSTVGHSTTDDTQLLASLERFRSASLLGYRGDIEEEKQGAGTIRYENESPIVIATDTSPDRSLILKMVDFQETLSNLTSRIMAGLAVSEYDWTLIRQMNHNLHYTFDKRVEFEWEQNQEDEVTLQQQQTVLDDSRTQDITISNDKIHDDAEQGSDPVMQSMKQNMNVEHPVEEKRRKTLFGSVRF